MYVKFEDGVQLTLSRYPTASTAVIENHKRDVLSVTVQSTHAEVKTAFNGQPWSIVDGESEYDKSNFTLVASICDNMDGTITVRVGRQNTTEETLQDEKNALAKQNVALSAANTEQADIINILAGGAV
ncbi:MAG: hypothetical protein IJ042_07385 [Butyricicoccus sp.]|nr:hypothetical protein [Butyricicoccus sp.]